MRTPNSAVRQALMAALLIISTSCSIMCNQKPSLRDTRWVAEYQEFVADAGNATVTLTLTFPSGKDFTMAQDFVMPPYPAMYMNPDGTVDMNPGHSSHFDESGTYRYDGRTLKLTFSDGTKMELTLRKDSFAGKNRYGQEVVFKKES